MNAIKTIGCAIVILGIIVKTSIAGPFGLKMGMKNNEIKGTYNSKTKSYITSEVPKPNANFDKYSLLIDSESGLAVIRAIGVTVNTSVYGTELTDTFNKLKEQLTGIYGTNTTLDTLRYGSIWNEPKDYMMGMIKKERTLMAMWDLVEQKINKDDIVFISLEAKALSPNTGFIILEYHFNNATKAIENLNMSDANSL